MTASRPKRSVGRISALHPHPRGEAPVTTVNMKASTLWLAVAVGWTVLLGSLAQGTATLHKYKSTTSDAVLLNITMLANKPLLASRSLGVNTNKLV